ncbi:unnamed protein product [Allacma fusca]|uniref:legumain n=1 Tax=Allacma fusca TaxID=39272 RepID=A0A8J2K5R1_9HEXA|nr:unnamed protein product [Allacma fusca]
MLTFGTHPFTDPSIFPLSIKNLNIIINPWKQILVVVFLYESKVHVCLSVIGDAEGFSGWDLGMQSIYRSSFGLIAAVTVMISLAVFVLAVFTSVPGSFTLDVPSLQLISVVDESISESGALLTPTQDADSSHVQYLIQNDHLKDADVQVIKTKDSLQQEAGTGPKLWAVLVAGSNEFYNYRHQADVCHAYQILRRNGIPPENIIVMMYDDIANSTENPTPGIIINRPNGSDVYAGVVKDYVGDDVTPENFMKVLLGDEEGLKGVGSGKVLKSGPNDHVFINFVDHGAPGLVAFPNDELHAKELKKVLGKMHLHKKFAKLVFYLEACESGSMFQNLLPAHWNIFATTAANSDESSYACYFDDVRQTYLGDVYSVMWMENADSVNLSLETLQAQFLVVRNETNTSHVQEFGDRSLRHLEVSQFLGASDPMDLLELPPVELDPIAVGDVPQALLERKLSRAVSVEEKREIKQKLNRLHKLRKFVTNTMMDIINQVTGGDMAAKEIILRNHFPLIDFDCYERAAKFFSQRCFSIAKNSFVTRKLYLLVNICERGWPIERIVNAMAHTCRHSPITGIN